MREKTQDRICYFYSCLRSYGVAADLHAAGLGQIGKGFLIMASGNIASTLSFFLLRLLFGERISCLEFVFIFNWLKD